MKRIRYSKLLIVVFTFFITNCSEESTNPIALSSAKEIESFIIESHSLSGEVNGSNKTVGIKITPNIDATYLTPTIRVSKGATINPSSGLPQDFTDTLSYSVTAEDKSTANYKVYTSVRNYILNSCFLVVHMQNYFVNDMGIHNSDSVISSIGNSLQLARQEHIPVIYTKSLPAGNREVIDELEPLQSEKIIESSSDQPVIDAINLLNVKNVVVVGIITHQCVKDICTALNGAGYNVILVKDATSVLLNQDINLIDNTCNELEQNGIVQLIATDEILF